MTHLLNISIKKKIICGFLLASISTLIVGIDSYLSISNFNILKNNNLQLLMNADNLQVLALTHRRYEKDLFLNIGNPKKQKKYLQKFKKTSKKTIRIIDTVIDMVTPDMKIKMVNTKNSYNSYISGFLTIANQVIADQSVTPQNANKKMLPIKEHIYTFEKGVTLVQTTAKKLLGDATNKMVVHGDWSKKLIFFLVFGGVGLCIIIGIALSNMISKPLVEATQFAEKIAAGDLSKTIENKKFEKLIDNEKDEVRLLTKSLNKMIIKLREMFKEITEGVGALSASSTELSVISKQMCDGSNFSSKKSSNVAISAESMSQNMSSISVSAEQISSSVTAIASSVEEMSATIDRISGNSGHARSITKNALKRANGASDKINDLGQAAKEISTVTETINNISEQTNLLALNATIEAARAGDAGKGFSVVANEIKELAKQTAQATDEIQKQIENIQKTTMISVDQIEEITNVINDVNDIVTSTSIAIEEQSAAIKDIASNVSQTSVGIQNISEQINRNSTLANEISSNISEVDSSSKECSSASLQVSISAVDLSKLAEQQKQSLDHFVL